MDQGVYYMEPMVYRTYCIGIKIKTYHVIEHASGNLEEKILYKCHR